MKSKSVLERNLHLYHYDHRGLPLVLIAPDNSVAWRAEYDEESGLYYNRHRYYSPGLGRPESEVGG
ncbi:RHS domain-containing protein [Salmonella enterica]|nr:RHS domain-containing protein [Salmonella enterica]EKT7778741.1 RHS domain-containing protein [Salmonella enterica]